MRHPFRLAGLTLGWLAGSVGELLLTILFTVGTLAPTETTEPHYRTYETLTWIMFGLVGAFFVLAPLGIAAIARAHGLRRTVIAYLALTGLLIVGAGVRLASYQL